MYFRFRTTRRLNSFVDMSTVQLFPLLVRLCIVNHTIASVCDENGTYLRIYLPVHSPASSRRDRKNRNVFCFFPDRRRTYRTKIDFFRSHVARKLREFFVVPLEPTIPSTHAHLYTMYPVMGGMWRVLSFATDIARTGARVTFYAMFTDDGGF